MAKPRHIIRSETDIPDSIDRNLISAYWNSTYRVFHPPFDIRLEQFHPALDDFLMLHAADSWAFVSPENPRSVVLPPADNQIRWELFIQHLRAMPCLFCEGVGVPATPDWPCERSCLILMNDVEWVIDVAKTFEQNAIVVGQPGVRAELWWL